jgi:hypothetical protein
MLQYICPNTKNAKIWWRWCRLAAQRRAINFIGPVEWSPHGPTAELKPPSVTLLRFLHRRQRFCRSIHTEPVQDVSLHLRRQRSNCSPNPGNCAAVLASSPSTTHRQVRRAASSNSLGRATCPGRGRSLAQSGASTG